MTQFLHMMRVHPGESYRVALMAGLFFFVLAANNLIKTLRDSIFLGHHSVSELPYLYIMVAVVAGSLIATYTKYTAHVSLVYLIVATNAVILSTVVLFWFVFTYYDAAWSHYVFYVWSAIVSVTAVSQLWTLVNQVFTPEEGKRSFGFLAAGGTVGGTAAGFGVQWTLSFVPQTSDLLWFVFALYLAPCVLLICAEQRFEAQMAGRPVLPKEEEEAPGGRIVELLSGSHYLRRIALLIFASVMVSTLIDFEFKSAAKQAYASTGTLALFFSSYYAWLSVASFFTQVLLTGRALSKLGLQPSLYLTPGALLAGAAGIMFWPSLLIAALTRMADATLRNSIHRTGMEVVYMAVPNGVMRRVKSFLDVVMERIGDAAAGFIILFISFASGAYTPYVHFVCIGLIVVWIAAIYFLDSEEALRRKSISWKPTSTEEWLARGRSNPSLME
jgi:AAA family ATP:ADP antiporter